MFWKAISNLVEASEKVYNDLDVKRLNPIEAVKKVKDDGVDGAVDSVIGAMEAPLSIADRTMDRVVYGKEKTTDKR